MIAFTREPSNSIDDLHQMPIVAKCYINLLQNASSFDVDEVLSVYEDVGDGVVFQQRLEGTQSKNLVDQIGLQFLLLHGA
jgi:hypothetical protein